MAATCAFAHERSTGLRQGVNTGKGVKVRPAAMRGRGDEERRGQDGSGEVQVAWAASKAGLVRLLDVGEKRLDVDEQEGPEAEVGRHDDEGTAMPPGPAAGSQWRMHAGGQDRIIKIKQCGSWVKL